MARRPSKNQLDLDRQTMEMSKRTRYCVWLPCAWLVLLAGDVAGDQVAQAATSPNIVFILADDVGREVLGSYGGTSYDTPQLDRLAREGIRFEHAYVMPACHPTRITLLTGQYPFRTGHPRWGTFPAAAEPRTLAQVLRTAGYRTAIAGKWQLGQLKDDPAQPRRLGFDEYCLFGWHEGPRYYRPHIWQNGALRDDVSDRYGPDVYCEFLIDFIRRHRDQRCFAFYSMALCHAVTNDLAEPVPTGPNGRYDSYQEMVAAMDQRVGQMVTALDELGLARETLVLYLSDNGSPRTTITAVRDGQLVYEPVVSEFGARRVAGGKARLIDGGTRVPLIAYWPGAIQSGQVNDTLVDASDLLPTLAEIADATLPSEVRLDGRSFGHLLLGSEGTSRSWVFAERKGQWFVKDRRWKLYGDGRLYDINADPEEQRPLAGAALRSVGAGRLRHLQRAREELSSVWSPPRD